MHSDELDMLLISGIQHFVFCRRQWALIHIEQQWEENYLTFTGKHMHERVHHGLQTESRGDILISRDLPVRSNELRIYGRCDVVEFIRSNDGIPLPGKRGLYQVLPVEYKRGNQKVGDEDILQLAAQAVCLEEMLACSVKTACIYYGKERHRLEVNIDDDLRGKLRQICSEMHSYMTRKHVPMARVKSSCKACSLNTICMPTIDPSAASKYMEKAYSD